MVLPVKSIQDAREFLVEMQQGVVSHNFAAAAFPIQQTRFFYDHLNSLYFLMKPYLKTTPILSVDILPLTRNFCFDGCNCIKILKVFNSAFHFPRKISFTINLFVFAIYYM